MTRQVSKSTSILPGTHFLPIADSSTSLTEQRGPPYFQNSVKSDSIFSQKYRPKVPVIRGVDPLEPRSSVPLNQACALFGSLLSEYYTSANFSNIPKNPISADSALNHPSSASSTGATGGSRLISSLSQAYATIRPSAVPESASSSSQSSHPRSFGEKIAFPHP